jgi:hypothetical protein
MGLVTDVAGLADSCKETNSTTATVSRSTEVYSVSRLWVGCLLLSSLVLLVLGFLDIILEPLCTAPDVLGYVSDMTRDNRHVKVPPEATALAGPRRARASKDMKVQIADVREHEEM